MITKVIQMTVAVVMMIMDIIIPIMTITVMMTITATIIPEIICSRSYPAAADTVYPSLLF